MNESKILLTIDEYNEFMLKAYQLDILKSALFNNAVYDKYKTSGEPILEIKHRDNIMETLSLLFPYEYEKKAKEVLEAYKQEQEKKLDLDEDE